VTLRKLLFDSMLRTTPPSPGLHTVSKPGEPVNFSLALPRRDARLVQLKA
jgi:hypothetical protein